MRWLRPVLTSRPFWLAMLGLVAAFGLFMFLLNFAIMPLWTRHDATISVPEVRRLPADEAEDVLERAGLRAELREQPYNPNIEADVVVDQTPLPNASVKPGRRIYYYVNVAPREMVQVPNVVSMSEGRAKPTLTDVGLLVGEVRTDTLHTPREMEGTVTRQMPPSGSAVPQGTRVTIWLSPGLGSEQVRVPDVTGLPPAEAQRILREADLWVDWPEGRGDTIRWQDPRAGNRRRQGEKITIHSSEPPEGWNPPPTPPREPTPDPESTRTEPAEQVPLPEPVEPAPSEPLPPEDADPVDPPPQDDGPDEPVDDEAGEDDSSR
jgi:beta-lactam-binding protein with PASTA domain